VQEVNEIGSQIKTLEEERTKLKEMQKLLQEQLAVGGGASGNDDGALRLPSQPRPLSLRRQRLCRSRPIITTTTTIAIHACVRLTHVVRGVGQRSMPAPSMSAMCARRLTHTHTHTHTHTCTYIHALSKHMRVYTFTLSKNRRMQTRSHPLASVH
jgi:hypothetical protein